MFEFSNCFGPFVKVVLVKTIFVLALKPHFELKVALNSNYKLGLTSLSMTDGDHSITLPFIRQWN
jgi:hypothetical protein